MKYVYFFRDRDFTYAYAENGKIYRTKLEMPTIGLKFYASILIITIFIKILEDLTENILNNAVCLGLSFFGFIITAYVTWLITSKILKKGNEKLQEFDLSTERFTTYIIQGKELFQKQLLILLVFSVAAIFSLVFFCFFHSFLLWLSGIAFTVISTGLFVSDMPFAKYRFFKQMTKRQ